MNSTKHCCHVVYNMTDIYYKLDNLYMIYRLLIDPSESKYIDDTEIASVRRRLYLIGDRAANLLINTYRPCRICKITISNYYRRLVLLTAKMYS